MTITTTTEDISTTESAGQLDAPSAAQSRRALQAQGVYLGAAGPAPRAAFLFPGHGAQYPDMFADLAAEQPVVAETFERIDETYRELTGRSLTGRIFRARGGDPAKELQDPEVMQPAIFAGSIAVFRLLEHLGVAPEMLIGHSLGELSALVAAGALSVEDGVRAVYGRGAAVKTIPADRRGGMLSLQTDSEGSRRELARLLLLMGSQDGCLSRSIVNSPDQTVLSGDLAALVRAEEYCREHGIKATRLRVSHGFHSALLADAVPHLERTLRALDWHAPKIPVLSTVIGDHYTERDLPDLPVLLARQLVTPFSFQELIGRMHTGGIDTFVEVGPKSILSGLVERILADQEVLVTPTNIQSLGGVESIRRFTAFAEVHGLRTDKATPPEPKQESDSARPTTDQIRARLLETAARTTGYPVRLLDPAQLMGAGLGLSPRVRQELAAALAAQLGLDTIALDTERDAPLGELLDRIVEASRTTAEPAPTPSTAPTPVVEAPVEVSAEVDRVVWEVTEAKTGYPADLLEADLDLEADLGIDSVKQAEILGEVREVFGLPVVEDLDTAELNTLRKIAGFVNGLRAANAPTAITETPVEVSAELSAEVDRVVWEVTEAKTGYPADLLEADLDLEADLGIDSVKQAEILGEVREVFGLPVVEDLDAAELNTLRKIAGFVTGLRAATGRSPRTPADGGGADDDSHIHEAAPEGPVLPPILERTVDRIAGRYVPLAVASPLDHPGARPFALDGKTVVVITGRDSGLAEALLPLIAGYGARPRVVAEQGAAVDGWPTFHADFADPDSLVRALNEARGDGVQVVVNLHPYGTGPLKAGPTSFDLDGPEWSRLSDQHFTVNLLAAKAYYADLGRAGAEAGYFAATAVGGVLGLESDGSLDPLGGLTAGFVKSLDLELPDARAKVVDFTDGDATAAATALIEEITTVAEPTVEVGYVRGVRKTVQVLPHEIEHHPLREPLRLDPGSVVVFSGGSRGITYECAKEIARLKGVHIVILGRTRPADGTEEWMRLDDDAFEALGREWFQRARAEGREITPVAARKEFAALANSRSLYRNLAELRSLNELTSYEICDVADEAQVAGAIGRIRARHGRIDGIVHAAGLESVATVPKKSLEHARNVVRVKADGAHHLWHAVRDDEPAFFCFFGSFLGRFGMDGQVDYTAGADLVSKLSALLARERPRTKVFTLCWTGWAEVGMAATEAVRHIQEEVRGLRYLSVEEGVQHFARELFHGGDDPEVLVFGEIGKNSYGGQDASMDAGRTAVAVPVGPDGSVRDRIALPLIDAVDELSADRVRVRKRLDPGGDRYLGDHLVKGAGTFPGVLHIEAQAQTAGLLAPEYVLAGAESVEFLKFIRYLPNFPVELSLEAYPLTHHEIAGDGLHRIATEIRSDLVTADGRVLETGRLHSRGTHLFAGEPLVPPEPDHSIAQLLESEREFDLERFYERVRRQITFGPSFRQVRRVAAVGDVADGRLVSEIGVASGRGLFSSVATPRLRTLPVVIDNAWRSALVWAYHQLGIHVVPISVAAMRFYRNPLAGETVYADSTVTDSGQGGPGRLRIDTRIVDAGGALLCDIQGLLAAQVGRDEGDTGLLDR
ncbi:SDR family NAD(P)-dependent oxidoreductase [Streptomyces sp. BR1]|uniref:SDR family NAD(P)-dependent oxidoreductase n=1 Tax=Streptomyces sp. BR1 TaxID=1592323 RepID=UPI00402B5E28